MFHKQAKGSPVLSQEDRDKFNESWLTQRRVMLNGEIGWGNVADVRMQLAKLDYESNESITLVLESGGGDLSTAFQLQDFMNGLNSPVHGLVMGDAISAAVAILQMCTGKRQMLPASRIQVHMMRSSVHWAIEEPDELKRAVEFFQRSMHEANERLYTLFEKRSLLTRDAVKELFRFGELHKNFLSANQAFKLGLIDEIVTDFKLFPKKEEQKP